MPRALRHAPSQLLIPCVISVALWLAAGAALAQPTPEEFFQSMNRSMERNGFESVDLGRLTAVLLAAAGLAILGTLVAKWRRRPVQRRNLNHSGKLARELVRSGAISAGDMKKLTAAAEKRGLPNPLLLALCPSLLKPPPPQSATKPENPMPHR
jgi:hypothetical protein